MEAEMRLELCSLSVSDEDIQLVLVAACDIAEEMSFPVKHFGMLDSNLLSLGQACIEDDTSADDLPEIDNRAVAFLPERCRTDSVYHLDLGTHLGHQRIEALIDRTGRLPGGIFRIAGHIPARPVQPEVLLLAEEDIAPDIAPHSASEPSVCADALGSAI